MGPEVAQLEAEVAGLSQTRHAIGCASGTDALLLPLKALDLKPGDEVITTAFTFFATAGAIHNAGGTPVFVDIDPATFNIIARGHRGGDHAADPGHHRGAPVRPDGADGADPADRRAARARGHRGRGPGDRRAAQDRRNVAHGGRARHGRARSRSSPARTSGGWGDGGMMVTQDDALAERLRRLRLHGGAKQYYHDEVGTNSRLDTLQAAVLLAKLPHLAAWSEARRRNAARYTEAFTGHPDVCPPHTDPANEHIYHQYTIRVPAAGRAPGASQGAGDRHGDLLSARAPPAALLRAPGLRRGSLPVTEAATGRSSRCRSTRRCRRRAAGRGDRGGAELLRMSPAQPKAKEPMRSRAGADRARPSGARRCSASWGWATSACRSRWSWRRPATGCSAST